MRRFSCVCLVGFALVSPGLMAQTVIVQQAVHKPAWDYLAANITAYQVTRFELCLDQVCASVGLPVGTVVADTAPGALTYTAAFPLMAEGPHSFTVRACNATTCSVESVVVPFTVIIAPTAPINPRVQ